MSNKCSFQKKDGETIITCKRDVYSHDGCILHLPFHDKDKKAFLKEVNRTLESKSEKQVDFRGVHFLNDYSWINGKTIDRSVLFDFAVFLNGTPNLEEIDFRKTSSFRYVSFNKGINFRKCSFIGGVNFSGSVFQFGRSAFDNVDFHSQAMFKDVRIDEAVVFKNETKFESEVSFEGSISNKELSFYGIQFQGPAMFHFDETIGLIFFSDVTFNNDVSFSEIRNRGGELSFQNVSFIGRATFSENYGQIRCPSFEGCNMSGVRLLSLPISEKTGSIYKLQMENCNWRAKRKFWIKRRDKLGDESDLLHSYELLRAYQKLQKRYFEQAEYQQAGEFYVGAMIQNRKLYKGESLAKRIDEFYSMFSRYGESVWRPFIALISMWLFVPMLLLHLGIKLDEEALKPTQREIVFIWESG